MADFEAVIRRTIHGLVENTPEMRGRVYEKAKGAVVRQLRNMSPRPSNDMIDSQLAKLEAAILAVESGAFAEHQERMRHGERMRRAFSSTLLTSLLPPSIAVDFFDNLSEIYEERWLPRHGEQKAKWRWRQECISMIARYWLDMCVTKALRWARFK